MPDSSHRRRVAPESAAQPPASQPRRWWHEPIMWLVVGGPVAVVLAGIVTAWLAVSGADPLVAPDVGRRVQRALEPALKARNAASTDAARQSAQATDAPQSTSPTVSGR